MAIAGLNPAGGARLLERWNVSPNVAANLVGLLTDAEIAEAMPLLEAAVRSPPKAAEVDAPGDPDNLLTGLDDHHHSLLAGPCDPAIAEAESDGRFVQVIAREDTHPRPPNQDQLPARQP